MKPFWIQADGSPIEIKNMSDDHLVNLLNLISLKESVSSRLGRRLVTLKELEAEARKRKLSVRPIRLWSMI